MASPPVTLAATSFLPELGRLDGVVGRGVAAARRRFGEEAAADGFRGLYVSAGQAERALRTAPGEPLVAAVADGGGGPSWDEIVAARPGWGWLRDECGLSDLELDVVLLALGPEVDLRYERLYGYLQDDVSRRRPTVNLVLDLLTGTTEERLAARARFRPEAPLLAGCVVTLAPEPRGVAPPLLAHVVVPDRQVVDIVLGGAGLDPRLSACAALVPPRAGGLATTPLEPGERQELRTIVEAAVSGDRAPLCLHFCGPPGSGRRATAEALAGEAGVALLALDLVALADGQDADHAVLPAPAEALVRAGREAARTGAVLYVEGVDEVDGTGRLGAHVARALGRVLTAHPGVAIVAGTRPWRPPPGAGPLGVVPLSFARPGVGVRRAVWERALAARGVAVDAEVVGALAGRFRCGPGPVDEAVAMALAMAGRHHAAAEATPPRRSGNGAGPRVPLGRGPTPTAAELFAAARAQSGHELARLAHKVEAVHGWDDIVLPPDARAQLHELCDRVARRPQVMGGWGFDRALSLGKGVCALFAGPPGTGKTMAAEVVAHELGLDLYKVDLPNVLSKYIGETEKNLERIFGAAQEADVILFFDEADALFGKRSDVRDAHDRYANLEVSYLLQRMERYDGVAILATNLRAHLDDAFARRLQFVVELPFPDDGERRAIWEVCFPPEAPRADDLDLDALARDHRLAGGNIRNVVVAAAFLAARDGRPIGTDHVLAAVRREYQKLGRVMPDPSPGPSADPSPNRSPDPGDTEGG